MATIEGPPASEPVIIGGDKGFRWIITDPERAHIGELLQCDTKDITLHGSLMNGDRQVCERCGKYSGLDDIIQNAMELKIHTIHFMFQILTHGPAKDSPAHNIICSNCGTTHPEPRQWMKIGWRSF